MMAKTFLKLAIGIVLLVGCGGPSESPVSKPHEGMAGMEAAGSSEAQMKGHEEIGRPRAETGVPVTLSPTKRQLTGVTVGPVERRPLTRVIRTVGRVEVDERRVAHLHIKFEGYIHDLFVNTTGERVEAGQPLFSIYSPELLATQEEYLLALKGVKQLSDSRFPEISTGAQSLLEATRTRLRLWDIEEVHLKELEETGRPAEHLVIHSPISGVVLEKMAVVGMKAEPGEELYKIADLSTVWVLADFYESEIPLIRPGQRATITVDAYPGERFHGVARYVYPYLEPETRTVKVRFEFPNPIGKLKPQMYATVELQVDLGTRLAVPTAAVLETGVRQIVFVAKGDGRYEPRTIRLGQRAEGWVEVLEGLKENEQVATSANFLIDSESRLQAATNAMGLIGMADWQMRSAQMGEAGGAPAASAMKQNVGGVTVTLTTVPESPRKGTNTVRIKVTDAQGQPVTDAKVRVAYTMAMPGMEVEEIKAVHTDSGVYEAVVDLGMKGAWDIQILIQRGGTAPVTAIFQLKAGGSPREARPEGLR
jgi:Cu(I)/Ag(I) efflux system membrane fusion protein